MFHLNRWLFLVVLLATRSTVAQEPAASAETVAELEGQTEGLLEELRSGRREADDLVARYDAADGEERLILRSQIRQIRERLGDAVDALVSHIAALEALGIDPTGPRAEVVSLLDGVDDFLRDDLSRMREQVEALRAGRRELAADELLGREQDRNIVYQSVDQVLESRLDIVDYRETLGLDVGGRGVQKASCSRRSFLATKRVRLHSCEENKLWNGCES